MRAAILVLLVSVTPALAAPIPAKSGQPYLEARKQMLAAGYSTEETEAIRRGCGIGWEDICRDYAETMDCRGTGLAGCRFVFWKDDQPVLIETSGENIADQKVKRVRVMTLAEQLKIFPVDGK